VGDHNVLNWCSQLLNIPATVVSWKPGEPIQDGTIPVYTPKESPQLDCTLLKWGKPNKETGLAMASYIEAAVHMIQDGTCAGMITCPIAKSTLNMAGYNYPGHTEMLASLCGTPEYAMMMAGKKLRVTLVTIHTGLSEVSEALSQKKIVDLIRLTRHSLRTDFGIFSPRIAVAGLNPHAGEDGLFGNEEKMYIGPAVQETQELGWEVSGPFPPDTVFFKAKSGFFDAVVCMYHDQGLIPFKLLHFEDGVNVTIGLPIVRTSVDHGTAYDIAGQGKAEATSLIAAVDMAATIAINRNSVKK
jgi:4-hydroxythreonine-4-phosphate dehydrogenase